MKQIMQKTAAAAAAMILALLVLSPAAYGLRIYDAAAQDYPAFSAAVHEKQTAQTTDTLIVKTDGTLPDFRMLHPVRTVQGPDDTYTVTFSSADEAADKLSDVCALRGVQYAEPNARVVAQSGEEPVIDYLSYGMDLMHAADFAADLAARADLQPVVVAVVDSGVDADNPRFTDRLTEGATMNGAPETQDPFGHGTGVAGVVADCTQGLPVRIMPVRVLRGDGSGSLLDAANGIRYAADHDAAIINISFVTSDVCSKTLHDAVDYACAQDALPVISAGNYARDMNRQICCPADCASGFVVSGCDRNMQFYASSCYGSTVDLCAPAVNVKSASIYGAPMEVTGTSYAAPHISAIAAMYRLYMPDADRAALERMLQLNTKDLGDAGYDRKFGWGLPDLSALDGTREWSSYRTVKDVRLIRNPYKTDYYYREPFDPKGFQIRVTYSDGFVETRSTQGVQFLGTEELTRGPHTIRAVFDDHEVRFDVTVKYRWWQWVVMIALFGWIWY